MITRRDFWARLRSVTAGHCQRLTSNTIGASTKAVITTVQRLCSMLKGEPDLEATSQFGSARAAMKEPLPVVYNSAHPPGYFDFIVVDECLRSIHALRRQVRFRRRGF